jgi:cytochrome P450
VTSPEQDLARNFDLSNLPPNFYADPFPWYRALQRFEPIKRLPDGSYFLTRHHDISYIYKNPTLFSSDKRREFKPKFGDTPLYEHHTTSLVFNDPPLHTRVRRIINGALVPRTIATLAPELNTLVKDLLDELEGKPEVDLIEDFAALIPIEVIGNLLAVPRDQRQPLRGWSLAILGALEPVLSESAAERGNCAVRDFCAYLDALVAQRRQHPGDPDRDVLTRLIQGDESAGQLSTPELLHNCIFLLNAGHETTTNLIGNGLYLLEHFPEQRHRLLRDPQLITTAVEEILRLESPNQLGNRITTKPVEIGGVQLPTNTSVHLCIAAANRDPEVFPQPEQFDISRRPNKHLAFGSGTHQCAGMSLARLEACTALSQFLQRFPDYTLSGDPIRGGRARFRGFLKLPCSA